MPRLKSANTFFLHDMSYVSKSIFEMLQAREQQIIESQHLSSRSGIVAPIKAFIFLYLTGMRVGELLPPEPEFNAQPVLTYQKKDNYTYMVVQRIAEKHIIDRYPPSESFPIGKPRRREVVICNIPIDDFYEWNLWNYITDNGNNMTVNFANKWGWETRNNLTHAIANAFKADLTDGVHEYPNRSLNCHILRHWRAFSLLINKGYDEPLVQRLFTWNDDKMLGYYASVRRMLNSKEQLQMIDRVIARNAAHARQYYDLGHITASHAEEETDDTATQ